METILFLAHTEGDGTFARPALEALAGAKWLAGALPGSTLAAGFIGESTQSAAGQTASCGASRFLSVTGSEFGQSRYATDAAAAEALCRAAGATIVIVPATARWARSLAGVAQRLGGRIDSHVSGISAVGGKLVVSRWYYRQRMEAVLDRTKRPWLILLETSVFPAWSGEPGSAPVEAVAVDLPDSAKRTRFVELRAPKTDEQTIRPDANLLFVTGAGWTKKQSDGQVHLADAAELILGFLRKTQSSLGSSKSLVDLSGEGQVVLPFLTHLNQVGQTGSTPRHPKGLATCCHGEEPHVVGWRFINERRAVNLDPNCGWARGKADVLYVADAFEVIKQVNALLAE